MFKFSSKLTLTQRLRLIYSRQPKLLICDKCSIYIVQNSTPITERFPHTINLQGMGEQEFIELLRSEYQKLKGLSPTFAYINDGAFYHLIPAGHHLNSADRIVPDTDWS